MLWHCNAVALQKPHSTGRYGQWYSQLAWSSAAADGRARSFCSQATRHALLCRAQTRSLRRVVPEVTNLTITLLEGNVKHSRLVHHVWSLCAQAAPLDGRVSGRQLVRICELPSLPVIGAPTVRIRRRDRPAGPAISRPPGRRPLGPAAVAVVCPPRDLGYCGQRHLT